MMFGLSVQLADLTLGLPEEPHIALGAFALHF